MFKTFVAIARKYKCFCLRQQKQFGYRFEIISEALKYTRERRVYRLHRLL